MGIVKTRINDTEIIVGRKGTGKSTYANKRACAYPSNKKVLIIDVNASPAYKQHKLIDAKTLLSNRWVKGVVRYYESDHDLMMNNIIKHCNNTQTIKQGILIVFEDCTKYIDANPGKLVKSFLVDHRMWNADLMFTFHSFKRIPPFFFEMCSYITVMKTQENFETPRNENLIPNYETLVKARRLVMASNNDYIHKTIATLI